MRSDCCARVGVGAADFSVRLRIPYLQAKQLYCCCVCALAPVHTPAPVLLVTSTTTTNTTTTTVAATTTTVTTTGTTCVTAAAPLHG